MAFVARVTVNIPHVDGIARDTVVNAFCVKGTGALDATHATDITSALHTFYTQLTGTQTITLDAYLSPALSRVASTTLVKVTDITTHLDGSAAGPPNFVNTMTLAHGAAGTALPDEVACALSVHGLGAASAAVRGPVDASIPTRDSAVDVGAPALHSGLDHMKARHMGRIYIGPLGTNALEVVSSVARPASAFITDLTKAADTLRTIFGASTDMNFAVWSRRNASADPITGGFVDDRFDSQRRRRAAATRRVIFGA